jgi:hypothetical protein
MLDIKVTDINADDPNNITATTNISPGELIKKSEELFDFSSWFPNQEIQFTITIKKGNISSLDFTYALISENDKYSFGGLSLTNFSLGLSYSKGDKMPSFKASGSVQLDFWEKRDLDLIFELSEESIFISGSLHVEEGEKSLLNIPPLPGLQLKEVAVSGSIPFDEIPLPQLGLSANLYIGGSDSPDITHDQLEIILSIGDPLQLDYISFAQSRMDIFEIYEIFSGETVDVDFPFGFEDVSFFSAFQNVRLTDGTEVHIGSDVD